MVILFIVLELTHIRQVQSFLGNKGVGTEQVLKLGLHQYAVLLGKGTPHRRLIWCLIPLKGDP